MKPDVHSPHVIHVRGGIGHPIGAQQLKTSVVGELLFVQCVTTQFSVLF
jgi:hypothetical protein